MPAPCNPPPPPSSGGGWGASWGTSWSSGEVVEWDANTCLDITFVVPPPLDVTYHVPVVLDASYDVQYASPLQIHQKIPPPLPISYNVPATLDVNYDVLYASPLEARYPVSPVLPINYEVLLGSPLSVSLDVPTTGRLEASFGVTDNFDVHYIVPMAILGISYEVPADHRSLVIDYGVDKSHRMLVNYRVERGFARGKLTLQYQTIPAQVVSPLVVHYTVTDASVDADCAMSASDWSDCASFFFYGASTQRPAWHLPFEDIYSLSLSASEGAIRVEVEARPTRATSIQPGDSITIHIANRSFRLVVKEVSHDNERARIRASILVDELLDKIIASASDGRIHAPDIYAWDPIRVKVEADGGVCREDIAKLRQSVRRPTVGSALLAAARRANIDVKLIGLHGLNDRVPFDLFFGRKELSVADVFNTLVGWQNPYYFFGPQGELIVASSDFYAIPRRDNIRRLIHPPQEEIEVTEVAPELPRRVDVNGGPWPTQREESLPIDECAQRDRDPSEAPNVVIRSRSSGVVEVQTEVGSFVLHRATEREVYKECGRIIRETEREVGDILYPELFSDPDNPRFVVVPGVTLSRSEVEYEYYGSCSDAWVRKRRTTRKNGYAVAEGLDATLAAYVTPYEELVYEVEEVLQEWAPKGYLRSRTRFLSRLSGGKLEKNGDQVVIADRQYGTSIEVEEWHPIGDGLWYHSITYPWQDSYPFVIDPEIDDAGVGMAYATPTTSRTVTEITESQPPYSDCVAMMACSHDEDCRCGRASSTSDMMATYSASIDIPDGTLAPISINVPGINTYGPLPACCDDSVGSGCDDGKPPCEAPPTMDPNVARDYAEIAAYARRVMESASYVFHSSQPRFLPMPGDTVGNGLVVESNATWRDSDYRVSYKVVWLKKRPS